MKIIHNNSSVDLRTCCQLPHLGVLPKSSNIYWKYVILYSTCMITMIMFLNKLRDKYLCILFAKYHDNMVLRLVHFNVGEYEWRYGYVNVTSYSVPINQRSKFWLSVRPEQPKKSLDNQKYWCGCPTDNNKYSGPQLWKSTPATIVYLVQSTDNQKLGRTTKNCNLVVRGTTIYFSLIRTLQLTLV